MNGMVDSFNVSVAAGILMHHAVCDRIARLVTPPHVCGYLIYNYILSLPCISKECPSLGEIIILIN